VVADYHEKTIVNSELSSYHNVATIDTTKLLYIEDLNQTITIEEDVIVTEYDKESGKPIKETKTKRKITQDTNKATAEEEIKGIAEVVNDSTYHTADVSKKIDSSVEEESTGGQEAFGKWLGIIIGLGIVLGAIVLILYIRKKLRVS
jgi:sensor c-di-GMP phosphodiesterase-like protein